MGNKQFETSYGTLYTNVRLGAQTSYINTSIFCVRRLVIAIGVIFTALNVINIYLLVFSCLFLINFFLNRRPLQSSFLNKIEVINELSLLAVSYYMFRFTFMYLVVGIAAINFFLIGSEMANGVRLAFLSIESV